MASEVVEELKSTKKEEFVLKLDLEKAYDKVDWSFFKMLSNNLEKMD